MAHCYILTLDIGTSGTKTVLWDEDGRIAAQASYDYALSRPNPLWAEIDAKLWWQAVCATSAEVIAKAGVHQMVEHTPAGAHGIIFTSYMAGERPPVEQQRARRVFRSFLWQ